MPGLTLEGLRSRMVRAVTDRLVGSDAIAVRAGEGGEPWLPIDSPARQVHADIAMLAGGLRALLLQSLHPVAMQAVDDHSGYRTDPWGRLHRTAAFVSATTFGSVDEAMERIDLVRRIHDRVTGRTPTGEPYRASDPDLLMWIHVAELDSFLAANTAYARNPLPASKIDRYIADVAPTGEALGVIGAPRSLAELRRQLVAYRPQLRGTTVSRHAARMMLWDPPLAGAARVGFGVLAAGAAAILPAWARSELGLPSSVIMDRTVLRPVARSLLITLDRAFEAEGYQRSDS
ncbi:MAG: DUF2236 domain-containing protein [Microlunatus sp.]|nr:DUF2236 domain-containing protein [Microlunatus sp.]